jgi:UDP-galactopyranose mutase
VKPHILVVGAGFAGSVMARELADAGCRIHLVDRRPHIGGNAYDALDTHGILIHLYGPHIFHTNGERIFEYLSRFTEWRFYEHRVRAVVEGVEYPFPINRDTLNQLYGLDLDERDAGRYLDSVREEKLSVQSSEDLILSSVGRDLYEKFFLNYTRKQWGLEPSELKAAVAARIPVRTNTDDRYFTDKFQIMPKDGYTAMFEKILDHPDILTEVGRDFDPSGDVSLYSHVVYTGPIDAFYGYRFGKLPYRSLRFEHSYISDRSQYQSTGTVNYPNDHDYTRVTEFKHLTGQVHEGTSIAREYPQAEGDPYYPVPSTESELLFKRYEALGKAEKNVTFVGRLAQYRYYNMDQVVGAALTASKNLVERWNSCA